MKKLLSILLCVALVAALTPSVFAADQTYANTLSDNIWTFSEESEIAKYGYVDNNKNGSTAELVADSSLTGAGDNNTVIKFNKPSGGSNVNISFVANGSNVKPSEFKVAFDFKTTTASTKFKFVLKNGGDLNAVEWHNSKIKFLRASSEADYVGEYSANKWYNVELLFNIPKGYGQLKMREAGTSDWTTYNVLAGNGVLNGWTSTTRLAVGLESEGTAYVDNYYQNSADVPAAFLGSDDFTDGIDGWSTNGTNVISTIYPQQVDVDGNKMLEIKADNAAEAKNTAVKKDFPSYTTAKAAANTNYHFKFKLGGNAKPGTVGASLQTNNGSNTEFFIARVIDNDLKLFGGIVDQNGCVDIPATFGVPTETNLYEVEAVYNPSESTLTAVVTNDKGGQYIASSNLWSGTPNKFAFRHSVTQIGANAVARFDDFETDIFDTNGPAYKSSDVLSGDKACASIDETAVFTYDKTINQAALADATVTLDGATLDKADYTITSKGAQVFVAVKGLEKGKSYTVGLSGVKDILGNASADATEATVSFTTSNVDIIATKPVLSGTVLSTNVTSFYAQGKTLKLIVAVYDEAETMIEAVKVATVTADSRSGETLSYDFAEILPAVAGKKIKGFVWSGFDSMMPYAEAYK